MRGTASHDVAVNGAVVRREHMANPIFQRAPHDGPHFRWSFFALLGALMSGFPLGVARRALDELVALAGRKGRGGAEPLATEQVVQLEVARCEGALRAARGLMFDTLSVAWETSVAGDDISRQQRLAVRLAASNAIRAGLEVVDTAMRLAGGGALYDDNPLQRCWRDLHAGSSHILLLRQPRRPQRPGAPRPADGGVAAVNHQRPVVVHSLTAPAVRPPMIWRSAMA